MTEFVRIACNLDTILWFAWRQLIAAGACTPTTGVIGQNPDDNWAPPSTNYLVVSARRQAQISAETRTWQGLLTVRAYVFSGVDIGMRDQINLTQRAGNGVQSLNGKIIGALDLCDLTNGSFYFLAYPMRLVTQGDPVRTLVKGSAGLGWSYCELEFEFVYGEDPTYFNPEVNGVDEFTFEYDGSFM